MSPNIVGDHFPAGIIRDALVGVVDTEYLLHFNASGGKRGTKGMRDEDINGADMAV